MRPPKQRLVIIVIALAALTLGAILVLAQTRRNEDAACRTRQFEGSHFIVCTFDSRREHIALASRGSDGAYLRSFDALARKLDAEAAHVRFAMNAGMFNDAGAPIGLYVEDGVQGQRIALADGPGNFHMKPNGVFWQGDDGALHIDTSEDYARLSPQPRWATQSGPMLVINGALHPRFSADGASHFIRNGVGVRDAHTAFFVISTDAVSFGRFARFFRDDLHTPNALFFDGSVSSLWAPNLNRHDEGHLLGPMVVALDGPTRSP
jgi:uncharacterized protein YigE (DUF2233 family)